jgi:hypothetical protein
MMNFNFPELTIEELEKARDLLSAEINKRKEEEREEHKAELKKLLNRINELQSKWDFEISCFDVENGYCTTSVSDFMLID